MKNVVSYFIMLQFAMNLYLAAQNPCDLGHFEFSTKVPKSVEPSKFKTKKPIRYLLITGCARSGTHYITQVLNLCGLKLRHERGGEDGMVSWLMAAKSGRTPFGPGGNKFQFVHIFHQVRDPLKSIASICKEPRESWEYICKHVPEINIFDPLLVRAAKYYYYWNLMAEKKAEWTYRIEDLENVFDKMSKILGITLDKTAVDKVPKNIATRGYTAPLTWADIREVVEPELYRKLIKMAIRYGYPIN